MNRRVVLSAAVAVAALTCGLTAALAQTRPETAPAPAPAAAQPVDAAERKEAVEALAKELEAHFVFPEVGARYGAMLRANLDAGAYDQLTDPAAFAAKVTGDLQAVSKDGHLRLALTQEFDRVRRATGAGGGPGHAPEALEDARMIGEVAYLRFNIMTSDPSVAERARRFLLDHADAKAVIIDARTVPGGGVTIMDAIFPLLFGQKTTLVRMDTRAGIESPLQGGPTMIPQPADGYTRIDHVAIPDAAEQRLQDAPIYYLTSRRTASAAEHMAVALRRSGRATIVGETTRGAGHYGNLVDIGQRFAAFVPVGRSYDPDTGQGWEGTGVAPDVAVPADKALDEALARARAAGART